MKKFLFVVLVSNVAVMQSMMVVKNAKYFQKSFQRSCLIKADDPQQNIDKLNELLGVGKNASAHTTEGALRGYVAQNYVDARAQVLPDNKQLRFKLVDTLFTFDVARILREQQKKDAMQLLKKISEIKPYDNNQE